MRLEIKDGKVQGEIKDGLYTIKKAGTRSLSQNGALHLLFKQVSEECIDKGIDMKVIVRDKMPIECTPGNIKWLWKKLQKALFGTKSTTELKRNGEIEIVHRNFSKIIEERTEGQICVPDFPNLENNIDRLYLEE